MELFWNLLKYQCQSNKIGVIAQLVRAIGQIYYLRYDNVFNREVTSSNLVCPTYRACGNKSTMWTVTVNIQALSYSVFIGGLMKEIRPGEKYCNPPL